MTGGASTTDRGADETATAGSQACTTIAFVHGTRLTGSMWGAQQAALSAGFRILTPDLPGHGSRGGEPFTLDAAADALSAEIRYRATGGRAVVVGLSLGGYVAMALAAREPERVRGLVLSGSTAEPVGLRSLPFLALAAAMDRMDDERLDDLSARFFRARYPAVIAEPIVAGGFWWHGGAAALRALVGERFIPRLAAYPGRTLILNGEFDIVFRSGARAFAAAARDARRARLAGASHLANLDRPATFSDAVRRFARSLEAA